MVGQGTPGWPGGLALVENEPVTELPHADLELVELVESGETEAFTQLYREHSSRIYRYCFRATASWSIAEDLTAQVFLEAWRKRSTVVADPEAGLLPWLYGVALNVVRNQRRSEIRYQRFRDRLSERDRVPDFADEAVAHLDDERAMSVILQQLQRLSEKDREILQLCVWAELTADQAAVALGISTGAARTRLSRAKQALREGVER